MKIDLRRLRSDVKRLKADRVDSPIGKIKTGATEIIRSNFDELERCITRMARLGMKSQQALQRRA